MHTQPTRKTRRRFLGAAASLPLVTAGMGALAQTPAASTAGAISIGARLLQGYIQPAVKLFALHAGILQLEVSAYCIDSGRAERVERAFANVVQAWSRIELLRFGPLVQGNRFERLFFWPDPRGVMQRQLRALLQAPDKIPADLRTHSVAVQGLPALEALLYGNQGLLAGVDPATRPAHCALAEAVARNIASVAEELRAAWEDDGTWARDFGAPAAGNAVYRSEAEILTEVLKAFAAGLRFQTDVKLRAALGVKRDQVRAERLPFARSRQSLLSLAASSEALQSWHRHAAFAREPAWLRDNLARESQQSATLLRQTHEQVRAADDPALVQALNLVALQLDNARSMVEENLAAAVGVGLGFNALDGD